MTLCIENISTLKALPLVDLESSFQKKKQYWRVAHDSNTLRLGSMMASKLRLSARKKLRLIGCQE